jgi:hypothetical protein
VRISRETYEWLALNGMQSEWPAAAIFADYNLKLVQRIIVLGYPPQLFLRTQVNAADCAARSNGTPVKGRWVLGLIILISGPTLAFRQRERR